MQSHLSQLAGGLRPERAVALTIQGGPWQDVQRGTWLGQESSSDDEAEKAGAPARSGASTRHGAMAVNRSLASGIDAVSSRCIKVGLVRPQETAYKKILGAGILPGFRAGNADPRELLNIVHAGAQEGSAQEVQSSWCGACRSNFLGIIPTMMILRPVSQPPVLSWLTQKTRLHCGFPTRRLPKQL